MCARTVLAFLPGLAGAQDHSVIEYSYDRVGNIVKMDVSGPLQPFSYEPERGPEGSTVVLSGAGFAVDSLDNRVWFNGVPALVSQAFRRELRVIVPQGAEDGAIRVEVEGVVRESSGAFHVLPQYPAPVIDKLAPKLALPGDEVGITGRYFVPNPSVNQLHLGPSVLDLYTEDSNQLRFRYPADTGTARVLIRTEHGEARSDGLVFVPPPGLSLASVAHAERIAIGEQASISLSPSAVALLAYEVPEVMQLEASIVGTSLQGATVQLLGPDRQVITTANLGASGGAIGLRTHLAGAVYTLAVTPRQGWPLRANVGVGYRDLEISDLALGEVAATSTQQSQVPVTFNVTNRGTIPVRADWYNPVRIRAYASVDETLGVGDVELSGVSSITSPIAAGETLPIQAVLSTGPGQGVGDQRIFVKVDAPSGSDPAAHGVIPETDESNNVAEGQVKFDADLTISEMSIGQVSATGDRGYAIPVTYSVSNLGSSAISVDYYRPIAVVGFLSSDPVLSTEDQRLSGGSIRSSRMAPGESYTETRTFQTTAAVSGPLSFLLKVDAPTTTAPTGAGLIVETDESNNTLSATVSLDGDLTVGELSIGEAAATGDGRYAFPVTYTVRNLGSSRINVDWYKPIRVHAFLSRDGELGSDDLVLSGVANRTTPMEPGESYSETRTLTTPDNPGTGDWTFFIKVDAPNGSNPAGSGSVVETDETNNVASAGVQLQADLVVDDVLIGQVSATGDGRYAFPVTYTVRNLGSSRISVDWYKPIRVHAFLSRDGELGSDDLVLSGMANRTTPMEPGESYTETRALSTTGSVNGGGWVVLIKVDAPTGMDPAGRGAVVESNEANNVASSGVVLP
jgi:hypothetical protein